MELTFEKWEDSTRIQLASANLQHLFVKALIRSLEIELSNRWNNFDLLLIL